MFYYEGAPKGLLGV